MQTASRTIAALRPPRHATLSVYQRSAMVFSRNGVGSISGIDEEKVTGQVTVPPRNACTA